MTLKIVGAGLPRTGTTSLKAAIEQLHGPCYHMFEVFPRAEQHVPLWLRALDDDHTVFDEIFVGFEAAIDWPTSAFWKELLKKYPDALVVLTHRKDAQTWWNSATRTVWEAIRRAKAIDPRDGHDDMISQLTDRFHADPDDAEGAMAAYERWNAEVRAAVAPERLVEMTPGDGWEPLCNALSVPVPAEPYPHANSTADFLKMTGWE